MFLGVVLFAMSKFVIAGENMKVEAEGMLVTRTVHSGWGCAAGPALGPAGVHWAEFVNESGGLYMYCGLILDGWDVAGGSNAFNVDGHCFFGTLNGARWPGDHMDWPGRQPARAKGDRIGMRLDLGAGSLTVFKNGALLGVMQGAGLEGRAYRWAVSLAFKGDSMRLAAPSAASVAAMEAAMPGGGAVAAAAPQQPQPQLLLAEPEPEDPPVAAAEPEPEPEPEPAVPSAEEGVPPLAGSFRGQLDAMSKAQVDSFAERLGLDEDTVLDVAEDEDDPKAFLTGHILDKLDALSKEKFPALKKSAKEDFKLTPEQIKEAHTGAEDKKAAVLQLIFATISAEVGGAGSPQPAAAGGGAAAAAGDSDALVIFGARCVDFDESESGMLGPVRGVFDDKTNPRVGIDKAIEGTVSPLFFFSKCRCFCACLCVRRSAECASFYLPDCACARLPLLPADCACVRDCSLSV